ncbi:MULTISPECIES: hypothetical protein [unclassified Oceanispirochaeta]|uniref:CD0519/CD1768 family membrane protein n=1 Tax=unclassified Oceanispirochaeta TaxID=2635722 RepID=UPI000E08FAB9|nr:MULTISPECIES: hypothetical protein [unclassified Oceanispirochaeta]MBF9018828.1 hypothetical protein [Oceanispirochaeta sp. M2]NPD75297.1 hypothetical protein [Oceanispirochaeta sp. M1]RDG28854.1 hypothetical protein DV872_24695 [Oceanispirochaeta sp. M1]
MRTKKAFGVQTVFLLILLMAVLVLFGREMGLSNFFSTIMATAHDLLLNTVFFIMAITVLSGAFGSFLAEFGVLELLNWILAPVIRLIWKMPGVSAIGALSTYISDNPAIIALSKDSHFMEGFKEYQKPALANFGTAFGMGLIVTAFMMSLGFFHETFIGNLGAVVGSIVSTRIMLYFTKKELGTGEDESVTERSDKRPIGREIRDGNIFQRLLSAILEGGKNGLDIGFEIIPGVLVICTLVLMMTFGSGAEGYDGSAYQGVPILPLLGKVLYYPMKLLFGFKSPDAIAFPITALGAVGAALALVPRFLNEGLISGNDIAVFTAIGMCWSGYLSTHIAMMNSLGFRQLTSKAILSHTIGGLCAGVFAHYLYVVIHLF